MKKLIFFLHIFLFTIGFSQIKVSIDMLVKNAKIYTVNDHFETAESMAILNGKILAIGKYDSLYFKYNPTKTLDLGGKTVVPGFIDAHCHFTGYAMDQWKCELWGTKSWAEVLERLKVYEKNAPMKWIYGRSWDQNDWEIKEFPNKTDLDKLFPKRPVYLKRVDGHAAIANQTALDLAGITLETTVSGGEIEQKNGELTGVLIDNAMKLVEDQIPKISDELALTYIQNLQQECFSYGLTSVHDCGISADQFKLLEKAQQDKILKMKIFALLEDDPLTYSTWIAKGRTTNGNITFGGYKVYSDGALGSRGAALLEDYHDKPEWKGFLLKSKQDLANLASQIYSSNLQLCTHAIGDAANREILSLYGEILKEKNDKRWRIEHAQVVKPEDIPFFGKYSIIPSVQPTHATSDMDWVEERLGKERTKTAYAYKQLLAQNGWLPLGTDFPVEEINPMKTFYAAVVRKNTQNLADPAFQTENALTRQEALRGITIWAAKASFDETKKGSLEQGKWADFVVLNQDMMTVSDDKILETKVLETWMNGEKVHEVK